MRHTHEKRLINKTYACEKRPINVKRNLLKRQTLEKRPIKKTYVREKGPV